MVHAEVSSSVSVFDKLCAQHHHERHRRPGNNARGETRTDAADALWPNSRNLNSLAVPGDNAVPMNAVTVAIAQ